jgi:hypothetical protein
MRLLVPEILQKVSEADGLRARVAVLQQHQDNTLLKEVLRLNFDPAIEFDLPKGQPPFKRSPHPVAMAETNLYAESRRMYLVIKNHPRRPANIKTIQVENVFIQMLEGINGIEADMLVALKDKALAKTYKGLTEAVVRQAFPTLLPEKQAEKVQ